MSLNMFRNIIWQFLWVAQQYPSCQYIHCWDKEKSIALTDCGDKNWHITVTSFWARWRLKSPASRLFAQPFVQSQIKENIQAPRHWPLWGEITGLGNSPVISEFPAERARKAKDVSIWWRHHESRRIIITEITSVVGSYINGCKIHSVAIVEINHSSADYFWEISEMDELLRKC